MKLLITGGTGVLARASIPLLRDAGHEIDARGRGDLDLFDPASVTSAADGADGIMHLATRIPPREEQGNPEAWRENDRLRSEATPILVDAGVVREMRGEPAIVDGLDEQGMVDAVARAQPEVVIHEMTALAGKVDLRHFDRMFATTNQLRTKGTDTLLRAAK